jgi:hypothetical protein
MNHLANRLVVYETLYALNRDFEQVVAHLERLQELGMFERYLGNVFPIIVQETRAWANFEVFEALQPREQEDLTHFGRLHIEVLKDAGHLLDKRLEKRQKAAGKKGQRKRPGAGSWRMSGLAPVRDPAGHPPAAEQDQGVLHGDCLPPAVPAVPALEAEGEFERDRR